MSDREPVTWQGTIAKIDEEKRLVFGIASTDDLDKQGDIIAPADLEACAYRYVEASGQGCEMHSKCGVSKLVESMVLTPQKLEALGLTGISKTVWWVGFRVSDDATWAQVKSGKLRGFSIHGTGQREPIETRASKRSDLSRSDDLGYEFSARQQCRPREKEQRVMNDATAISKVDDLISKVDQAERDGSVKKLPAREEFEAALTALAREHQKENKGLTFEKAYKQILETPTGSRLFEGYSHAAP